MNGALIPLSRSLHGVVHKHEFYFHILSFLPFFLFVALPFFPVYVRISFFFFDTPNRLEQDCSEPVLCVTTITLYSPVGTIYTPSDLTISNCALHFFEPCMIFSARDYFLEQH